MHTYSYDTMTMRELLDPPPAPLEVHTADCWNDSTCLNAWLAASDVADRLPDRYMTEHVIKTSLHLINEESRLNQEWQRCGTAERARLRLG